MPAVALPCALSILPHWKLSWQSSSPYYTSSQLRMEKTSSPTPLFVLNLHECATPLESIHWPVAMEKKEGNFWAQMLGGSVNDFYFELAVRVVEVCRATRAENGGLIAVEEVRKRIIKSTAFGGGTEISDDDVLQAVRSLAPLDSGFALKRIGQKQMIRSVPKELNTDQATVLEAIQLLGYVTISMLQINLNWERPRARTVIDDLLADSLVWIDTQAEEHEYWSPSFMIESTG